MKIPVLNKRQGKNQDSILFTYLFICFWPARKWALVLVLVMLGYAERWHEVVAVQW